MIFVFAFVFFHLKEFHIKSEHASSTCSYIIYRLQPYVFHQWYSFNISATVCWQLHNITVDHVSMKIALFCLFLLPKAELLIWVSLFCKVFICIGNIYSILRLCSGEYMSFPFFGICFDSLSIFIIHIIICCRIIKLFIVI